MFVVGRVLDPSGKPVPNATVMVYASLKWPGRGDRLAPMWPSAIGQAGSDGSGRFRLDAPRTSSSRHIEFGAVAIAPGYGAGWVELDPDADQPAADITLRPEQVIQGRLFDVQGRPAQGVAVSVESMGTIVAGSPDMTSARPRVPISSGPAGRPAGLAPAGDVRRRRPVHDPGRGPGPPGRPRDRCIPDSPGRGPDVDTDGSSETKNVTMAVEPARIITGRVTYADTGKPAPHAVVGISTQGDDGSSALGRRLRDRRPGALPRQSRGGPSLSSCPAFPPNGSPI